MHTHTSYVDGSLTRIRHAIDHAAHYLPAQGPITVFIHHNTLHALEHLPFEEAVRRGAELFGCRAYLSEERYRDELAGGRIRTSDITSSLLETLGDEADIFVGLLGTRFNLRRAILRHPLHAVLPAQLDWVIAESRAFEKFNAEADRDESQRMVAATRRWLGRVFGDGNVDGDSAGVRELKQLCEPIADKFSLEQMESWKPSKWESFTLHLLWHICLNEVARFPRADHFRPPVRHRDHLLSRTGEDSDLLVNEVLIPFCLGLLDQGFSKWHMPDRDKGLFAAFYTLHGRGGRIRDRWLRTLPDELARIQDGRVTLLQSIQESLDQLGVGEHEVEPFITQTLLALRGFAGMIWQVERRADRVAHGLPRGSIIEFLAIRLILDRLALADISRREPGPAQTLARLRDRRFHGQITDPFQNTRCEAFAIFLLAQTLGWQPETLFRLSQPNWKKLLEEIRLFDETERLQIFHLAYERRFRQQSLDALRNHRLARKSAGKGERKDRDGKVLFDVITCIDEREESFRRHLEEINPACRTWAAAGFFCVAMYYRAADSFQYVPLCPIVVEPKHYVEERVAGEQDEDVRRRTALRRTVGATLHGLHSGSRSLFSGAATAVLGTLAAIPLVARVLFPRFTALFREHFDKLYSVPSDTWLQIERKASQPGSGNDEIGYSVDEMTDIVERLLRDIGMTSEWSRLVILLGHGSTSLNNPHESAHDCGACGGGRGGPNARAWAKMGNDPRVRSALAVRGLSIPDTTWFAGGYHNTCDDSVTLYDLSAIPSSHAADLETARAALHEACLRNAHERCRRFESADLRMGKEAALRHVEARVEDLSQVRPEYGHATNALCVVGRRELTRSLYLDRRAFLHSYDPSQDDANHTILARILAAVIPVCGGISLEYYFSYVDPEGYGCGTKLPHNISALVGVMNGAASDLRTGLPWQMVEIHEPVRLLLIIETTPQAMLSIIAGNPVIRQMVEGRWVQVATMNGESCEMHLFQQGRFVPHHPETTELQRAPSSAAWYRGWRGHLDFAQIDGAELVAAGKRKTP